MKEMLIKYNLGSVFYEKFPELVKSDYYTIVNYLKAYYSFNSMIPKISENGNSIIVALNIETIEQKMFVLSKINK